MKNTLLRQIAMLSKWSIYGLLVQLIFISLSIAAEGQAQSVKSVREQHISVEFNDVSLLEAFRQIEKETGYHFAYEKNEISGKVRLNKRYGASSKVSDVLLDISQQANLKFRQINKSIIVTLNNQGRPSRSEALEVIIDGITITGRVTSSEDDEGLPGVNVVVKGTVQGTVTDVEGNYTIEVPATESVLVFSSVGYVMEEVVVGNRSVIDLVLNSDIQSLAEIVVIGYGTQEKRDLTGSVAQVDGDDLQVRSVATTQEALAGKLAGVQVIQTTGQPGAAPEIRVRGLSSLSAGNSPLIVVDGFVGADLATINPNDIASVEVLKDASSAAIYGSRGANGVVIITTKQGTAGKAQFEVNASYGIQTVARKLDLLGRDEWLQAYREGLDNAWKLSRNLPLEGDAQAPPGNNNYVQPQYRNPVDADGNPLFPDTDWQDEIYEPAPMVNVQMGVRGGSDNVKYYISGNVLDQQGIMMETAYQRYNLRSNISADLHERLQFGLNLAPSYERDIRSANDNQRNGPAWNAIVTPPIFAPYEPDGSLSAAANSREASDARIWSVLNPVAMLKGTDNEIMTTSILSNAYLNYEIIDGLNLRANFGVSLSNSEQDFFQAGYVGEEGVFENLGGFAYSIARSSRNLLAEYTANYAKELAGGHNVNFLAGYTAQVDHNEFERVDAGQFVSDAVSTINNGIVNSGDAAINEWSLLSFIARANYSFRDKYLVTATFRRDGSSRFAENARYGNFPSASVGWLFSEEDFLQDGLLSYGKLRASYGIVGNFNIGNYSARSIIGTGASYYFNNTLTTGYDYLNVPDPNLGWEQIAQYNIGLELGFFEDRLRLELDYYNGESQDLLLNVPLPTSIAFNSYLTNLGRVSNTGFEVTLNTQNLVGEFKWETNFNLSVNRNEVLELRGNDVPIIDGYSTVSVSHITEVGEPIGNFYGYKIDGVFKNQEELDAALPGIQVLALGYPRIVDANEDGTITADDRTILGNPQPDFIYGMTNRFSFKGFDLSIVINGQQGGEIYNGLAQEANTLVASRNMTGIARGRYRSPSEPGDGFPIIARFRNGQVVVGRNNASTVYVEDATFFRIRDLTLGYDLSQLIKNDFFSAFKIYFNAHNLLTVTDYNGYDPELSSSGNALTPGVDFGAYPTARTYTFGINFGF
jgi:TonB-linked SusC/RagA family outer membrane protein